MKTTEPQLCLRAENEPCRPAGFAAGITLPFLRTPNNGARHDMLILNLHPDFTPAADQPPGLRFFNLDRP